MGEIDTQVTFLDAFALNLDLVRSFTSHGILTIFELGGLDFATGKMQR
jgi:hypothetical protein